MPYVLQFVYAPAVVYGDEFSNGADKIRHLSLKLILDRMAPYGLWMPRSPNYTGVLRGPKA